jgi:hypothetical protein
MNHLSHPSEEDLIAYHLEENTDANNVRKHLELCDTCATLSESIAQTLRVFSAEPVPTADLDRNWHRLRGNLRSLGSAPARRSSFVAWLWAATGVAAAALALLLFITIKPHPVVQTPASNTAFAGPGPLSAKPRDPRMAEHLEQAERLLTEVNHTSGTLDDATRSQAHDLLLKNAVYIQDARAESDLGTATVLEHLGRVLTHIDHAPRSDDSGWHLRLEWNTKGLLLDIRILQQNDNLK